jgi:hypothetical protein
MDIELKCLILDKTVEAAEELQGLLQPEITFSEFEVRRTLHKGVQAFRETAFDLCIVSEAFSSEELKAFFADVKTLQGQNRGVFIQVREVLQEGFDRRSLNDEGFASIITRKATEGDKAAIADAVKDFVARKEVRRRKVDVETSVKLIMLEIDRVAKERKRGQDKHFSRSILSDFMTEQLEFHSDVLDGYFKALETYSEKGKPGEDLIVELPREFLALCPPGIVDGTYVGTSLRVWEMLQEKFGKPVENGKTTVTEIDEDEPSLVGVEGEGRTLDDGADASDAELKAVRDEE